MKKNFKSNTWITIVTLGVLAVSIAYNWFYSKGIIKAEDSYSLYSNSMIKYIGYDFQEKILENLHKEVEVTEVEGENTFKLKYKSGISEEDRKKYEVYEIAEDYIIPIISKSHNYEDLKMDNWEYLRGISHHKLAIGTDAAVNYLDKFSKGDLKVYKVQGEYVFDYIVKDKNLLAFVYASEFIASEKYKPIKIAGNTISQQDYALKDKLCILVHKDFKETDKIPDIIKAVNFAVNKDYIKY